MYFALTAGGGSQRWQTSSGEPTAGTYGFVRELLRIEFPGGSHEAMFYVADVVAKGAMDDGELHYVMSGDEVWSKCTGSFE